MKLYDKHNVAFCRVKGHAGIAGNQRCDGLAYSRSVRKQLSADDHECDT